MPQAVTGLASYRALMAELVAEARRDIAIFSPALDPLLYGERDLAQNMRQFLLGSRRAQLRILLTDPLQLQRHGGRLLDLSRLMSSSVHFRVLEEPELRHQAIECLIVDQSILLKRNAPDSADAQLHRSTPGARKAARDFDTMWGMSAPASMLRRLHL
jgi:hypothetical protein